jgi:hypothetical protein
MHQQFVANSKRDELEIENADLQVEFKWKSWEFELW